MRVPPNEPIVRICRDCEQPFEITVGERAFFDARDLHYPRRCRDCRAFRRQERAQQPSPEAA